MVRITPRGRIEKKPVEIIIVDNSDDSDGNMLENMPMPTKTNDYKPAAIVNNLPVESPAAVNVPKPL